MALAVVRSLDSPRRLRSVEEEADYEQELVDQYLLAAVGAGICDSTISNDRSTLFDFIRFLGRPVWTARPADADRYLASERKSGLAHSTVQKKAWGVGEFFDFLIVRHQGDISALTGCIVEQVIDEFNRPAHADYGAAPVPPSEDEVETLFLNGGIGYLRRASFCQLPATTWPRRCGGEPDCG